jgi:hypothetical protein
MDYSPGFIKTTEHPPSTKIMPTLYLAAKSKNMKPLEDLLLGKILPDISTEVKEKEVLKEVALSFHTMENAEDVLYYLIFDYKINDKFFDFYNKDDVLHLVGVDKAKEMFDLRKKREDLYLDLNEKLENNNKISKKPKV